MGPGKSDRVGHPERMAKAMRSFSSLQNVQPRYCRSLMHLFCRTGQNTRPHQEYRDVKALREGVADPDVWAIPGFEPKT